MHRPLGISSTMFAEQFTDENLQAAAAAGIETLEVYVPVDGELYGDDATVARVGRAVERAGLSVWSIHAPFGGVVDLSAPDELQRRQSVGAVERAAEIGAHLGAALVVIHAGLSSEDEEEHQLRWRQSLRSVNCLLKRTAQLGLRLAIEYLPANKPRLCNSSTGILEFFSLCDGEASVCLDTNHANLREPLADAVRALGERIATVHISDNDGLQERHAMPGDGVIDWTELITLFDEIGYTGPLLYEVTGAEDVPALMKRVAANARELLGWRDADGA